MDVVKECEKNIYNNLKKRLGEIDSINEYQEALLRYAEQSIKNEDDFQQIAVDQGIKVNDVNFNDVRDRVRRNYIISEQVEIEKFLDDYIKRVKEFGSDYKKRDDGDAILKSAYRQFLSLQNKQSEAFLLYLICDYYRLVRNASAHSLSNDLSKTYEELMERKDEIETLFPKLAAPNNINEINFDDFILFSRAFKKLASILLKQFEYDAKKLLPYLIEAKRYKNNQEKLKKYLRNELLQKYRVNETKVDKLIDNIITLL